MEAKIAIAALLLKYKVVAVNDEKYKMEIVYSTTMQMKNGFWVYLIPRV